MIPVNENHRGKYSNAKTGIYIPKNPIKYIGKYPIEYKSELEYLAMRYLDTNNLIIQWGYENSSIKYFDKIKNKVRRYYIDFIAVAKVGNTKKTIWIEVKTKSETIPPTNKKNIKSMSTYITNVCKWEAAKKIAQSKGYSFHLLTEEQLKLY